MDPTRPRRQLLAEETRWLAQRVASAHFHDRRPDAADVIKLAELLHLGAAYSGGGLVPELIDAIVASWENQPEQLRLAFLQRLDS